MLRRILLAGTVAALAAAAACTNNDTAGTAGTVTVRAYVDADGSGTYSTGDIPIAGMVTLAMSGGSSQQAATGSDGTATFDNVAPGSYSATLQGTVPGGAELATSSTPVVVVPFQGGTVTTQFRYVLDPGTVAGVMYRDNNSNGSYDAGVDTPAPGIPVALYTGTDTTAAPVATTTTGSAGDFAFHTVRPGAYTVLVTPIPTISVAGGDAQPVNVAAATTAQASFLFTGTLLSPLAEVRSQPSGTVVAFTAVAAVNGNTLTYNNIYVQDNSSGTLIYGSPGNTIMAGDTVRVVGATSYYNNELEIAAPSGGALSIAVVGHGPVPQPRTVTVGQLNDVDALGTLVRITSARVTSVASTGSTSYNVNLQGPTAADTFQIRIGNIANIGIPMAYWEVGRSYDVTGLDGNYKGEPQLKPRSADDVTAGQLALTIAEARAKPTGDTVTVIGVVYVGTATFTVPTASNYNIYIQDATGGTQVYNVPTSDSWLPGDSVQVTGRVSPFDGEYEIARFSSSSPPVIQKLGAGATVVPRTISGAELEGKVYDGSLVRVLGLTVTGVGSVSGSGGYNVSTTAPDGTAMTVRIDATPVNIPSTFWQVGTMYDVVGASLNFSTNGTTFTPEIKPRSPDDVTTSPANVVSIATAKGKTNDTTTVEGVVTATRGTFRTDNGYIEDATSGIQIFNLPSTLNLSLGDLVIVHGKVAVFSGESELENNGSTDSIRVTVVGHGAPPAPRVTTGADFLARTFEGELLTLQNVTVLTVGTPSGSGTYTVTGTADDGSAVTIFMSAPTGAVPGPALFTVGSTYDITGIATPFSGSAELKPRGASDVVAR